MEVGITGKRCSLERHRFAKGDISEEGFVGELGLSEIGAIKRGPVKECRALESGPGKLHLPGKSRLREAGGTAEYRAGEP